MAEPKTRPTDASVLEFLNKISPESKRNDGLKLLEIFKEETNETPVLWGPSIIGFGSYAYTYSTGKSMDWIPVGYSPRKASISLYLMISHEELAEEFAQFGKHKLGKGCIYFNKLEDIDEGVLRKMISKTYRKHTQ